LGRKLVPSTINREEDAKLPPEQHRCTYGISLSRFNSRCASIDYLLRSSLSSVVQRRVIDQTGLTGTFDIDLTWDPALDASGDQRATSDAPSIFTALREQLGLRLEPGKARMPVLVIDSVEPPTEN